VKRDFTARFTGSALGLFWAVLQPLSLVVLYWFVFTYLFGRGPGTRDNDYIFSTTVVVSAREETDVGKLASSDKWTMTEPEDNQRVWTDDYSNIVGALWRRLRDGEQ